MATEVEVRPARVDDIPELVELNGMVQQMHIVAEPAVFKPTQTDEVAGWFRTGVEAGSLLAWVAEIDRVVVGYVTVSAEERDEHVYHHARLWWEIDQIGVRSDWRRRGVARALLATVAGEAVRAGVRQLQVSSWAFNTDALTAWQHLGFEPLAVRFAVDPSGLGLDP